MKTTIIINPYYTMLIMEIAAVKQIIKDVIKEAIKEAEKKHRVYKLDELLAELDDE